MSSTVIIIPTRLQAKRLPNKPLKIIKQKEMILHVYELAVKSAVGEVLVVTPDKAISELIKKNGGKSFISQNVHETGTDRVFEGFKKFYSSKPEIIINLQGDMPNIEPNSISKLTENPSPGLNSANLSSSSTRIVSNISIACLGDSCSTMPAHSIKKTKGPELQSIIRNSSTSTTT